MPLRRRLLIVPLILTCLLLPPDLAEVRATRQTGQQKAAWEVKLAADSQARSNVEVRNDCSGNQSFTAIPRNVPYLQLPAPPTVTVAGRSSRNMPVSFNTAGMRPGQYEGILDVKCDTCRYEPGCRQETERLRVRLTVVPAEAAPTPTPTAAGRTSTVTLPPAGMIPQPQESQGASCNDPGCKVDRVILNTGFNQPAGGVYTPVTPDGYWELVNAPNTGLAIPTPAWVITSFWGNPWQDSGWISAYNTASWTLDNPAPEKPYSFQRCFCTCDGVKMLDIDFLMLVDNVAQVYFDNMLIGQQTDKTTGSFTKPLHVRARQEIKPGEHCIRVDVRNLSGVAMGLNINGGVKSGSPPGAPLFLSPACCQPAGKIMGRKIDDTNCDGKLDNEPGLAGWTITATHTGSGAAVTSVTDANGFYYFNDLSPGTYTISESPQAGWSQTAPGGAGTYAVTLGANEVIQRDFGNCRRAQNSCAQVETREVSCKADGAGGYVYTFSVTNKSGKTVQQILLTPPAGSGFTLSQQVFNLPSPLPNGQAVTLTVNIGNVKPGEKVCFLATLMPADGPCCTVEVCPVLPSCCAQVKNVSLVRVPGASGVYDYTFTIVNLTPNVVEHVYLNPPSGVTVMPGYLPVSIPPNAGSVTQTVRLTGINPGGAVCLKLSLHSSAMRECCSLEHCITIQSDTQPGPGKPVPIR